MKSFYRKSLKWNKKLVESKYLRISFYLIVFLGLFGALFFGKNFILYGIAPAISSLFIMVGVGQLYIAFGCLSSKAILEAIFPILFGGLLIAAGLNTLHGVISGYYT